MLKNITQNPFFILDIANNHFGDQAHAKLIIDKIAEAVADEEVQVAIKFQYRDLDTFIHPNFKNRRDIKYVDRFQSTELKPYQLLELADYVRTKGLGLITTPFDESSVLLAIEAKVDAIKIASASCDDSRLLSAISKAGKPIIASTGGASISEIDKLVSTLESTSQDFAIMHCVAIYPSPNETLNLRQINYFRDRYPNVPIGWSTHEDPDNLDAIKLAAACGAQIFERHVGIETSKYPQNPYSSSPKQIAKWIKSYKLATQMLGSYERMPSHEIEKTTLRSLKRAVFASNSLPAGHKIGESDLYYAIPSSESQLLAGDTVLGRTLQTNLQALSPISVSDLSESNQSAESQVDSILYQIRGLLSESRTAINYDADFELSHHYGLHRFREFGVTLITCINREYAKKILVQLPRQKHPYHYHKIKEETFQLLWGDIEITVNGKKIILRPGDTCLVKPGEWHKFQTLNGAVIEEISTTYKVSDSCYEDEKIASLDPVARKTKVQNWQPVFGFIKKLV